MEVHKYMGVCPICHKQFVDRLYQKNGKCSQCGQSIIDYLREEENKKALKSKKVEYTKGKVSTRAANVNGKMDGEETIKNSHINRNNEQNVHDNKKRVNRYKKVTKNTEGKKTEDILASNNGVPVIETDNVDTELEESEDEIVEQVVFPDEIEFDDEDFENEENTTVPGLNDDMPENNENSILNEDMDAEYFDETLENDPDDEEYSLDQEDEEDETDSNMDEEPLFEPPAVKLRRMLEENKNKALLQKECDMEFNFNKDGFYDDNIPPNYNGTSGFNVKNILYILIVFIGLVLLATFLVYWA